MCFFTLCFLGIFRFLFKQMTAYEWRISDWSSDVCSSDLAGALGPSPTDSVTVDANGVETAWRGTNVFAWTQSNRFAFKQSMWSTAFGAKYDLGGWKVDAEGSYGKATERTTQTFVSWATKAPGASMWYDTTVDPDGPISFGFYDGFDPTDQIGREHA